MNVRLGLSPVDAHADTSLRIQLLQRTAVGDPVKPIHTG